MDRSMPEFVKIYFCILKVCIKAVAKGEIFSRCISTTPFRHLLFENSTKLAFDLLQIFQEVFLTSYLIIENCYISSYILSLIWQTCLISIRFVFKHFFYKKLCFSNTTPRMRVLLLFHQILYMRIPIKAFSTAAIKCKAQR